VDYVIQYRWGKDKVPLKDRKKYNEYMRNYKQKRTRVLKKYSLLHELLLTQEHAIIFISKKEIATVSLENLELILQKGSKFGTNIHKMRCFEVKPIEVETLLTCQNKAKDVDD